MTTGGLTTNSGCVAADADGVYVVWTGDSGYVARLNSVTGALVRRIALPFEDLDGVAVMSQNVYVGGKHNAVNLFAAAYDKTLGARQWFSIYHSPIFTSGALMTVTPKAVVLAGGNAIETSPFYTALALAFDRTNGDSLWVHDSLPIAGAFQGVASDSAGNIYALPGPVKLSPNGAVVWANQGENKLLSDSFGFISAVVKGDTLFVANGANRVWLLSASTGGRLQ